jgi:pyruvate formate lyase activating enzyme
MNEYMSVELHPALLFEKLADNRAKCNVCQRRCNIADGKMGLCLTRINKGGEIFSTIYGVVSSMAVDPIEKKPVYHYLPGTKCFSMGTFGCNFRCVFCQNWQIAYVDGTKIPSVMGERVTPESAVEAAIRHGCASIAWTYNEPSIWLEYTIDCAKLAKARGLRTIYVTNGYITPEGLDLIGPYLDVYRVDLKSFSDEFYRKLINVPSAAGVFETAKIAKEKWRMHVETVTNIVPTWNDDPENLRAIARWIKENLGEMTPWHVTRFFPCAKLTNVPPTPLETLRSAKEIGTEEGLKFVYVGNVAGDADQDTICPSCGSTAISRMGYETSIVGLTPDGRCSRCGHDMGIVR